MKQGGATMNQNQYLVTVRGASWTFNHLNKAVDFVRTMMQADGDIEIMFTKVTGDIKEEEDFYG